MNARHQLFAQLPPVLWELPRGTHLAVISNSDGSHSGDQRTGTTMRGYTLCATILNSLQKHLPQSNWMPGLAAAMSPSLFGTGTFAAPVGTIPAAAPSAHDLFLTALVLVLEITLFISIPIYLRARRRDKIRSRIRILYDSRRAAPLQVLKAANVRRNSSVAPRKPATPPFLQTRLSARSK